MKVMPVQADFQRQHTLLTQRALQHFKNTVTGTRTHTSRENIFFFKLMECDVRLQLLSCLGNGQNPNGSSLNFLHLSNLLQRRDQRHHLPISHKSRQKTVSRSRQPGMKRLFKKVYWCDVCKKYVLESNVKVWEEWSSCLSGLMGCHLYLNLHCCNSSWSSWGSVRKSSRKMSSI